MVEGLAELRLPPRADRLLQRLMDGNTESSLSPEEREELEALVRAQALRLLGRTPH